MPVNSTPFNPLERANLGASVANALLQSPVHPLAELEPFVGAGVYAIYYSGKFPLYKEISERNLDEKTFPIYVGKAIPAGGRKGVSRADSLGQSLYNRLREHGESIKAAKNLKIEDFSSQLLVVEDIWIPLGESLLIQKYRPLWNTVLEGFGNHDPGKGRYNGQRSRWDMLHPGRDWAARCQPRSESERDIVRAVRESLSDHPITVGRREA